jgi:hypothetical protein
LLAYKEDFGEVIIDDESDTDEGAAGPTTGVPFGVEVSILGIIVVCLASSGVTDIIGVQDVAQNLFAGRLGVYLSLGVHPLTLITEPEGLWSL